MKISGEAAVGNHGGEFSLRCLWPERSNLVISGRMWWGDEATLEGYKPCISREHADAEENQDRKLELTDIIMYMDLDDI